MCRRPLASEVRRVMEGAASLPCIMEEASMLATVLSRFAQFQTCTEALLNGYLSGSVTLPTPEELSGKVDAKQTQHNVASVPGGDSQDLEAMRSQSAGEAKDASGDGPADNQLATVAVSQSSGEQDKWPDAQAAGQVPSNSPAEDLKKGLASEAAIQQPGHQNRDEHANAQAIQVGRERLHAQANSQTALPAQGKPESPTAPEGQPLPTELHQVKPPQEGNKGVEAGLGNGPGYAYPLQQDYGENTAKTRRLLSQRTLLQLLKSAVSVEMDMGDLPQGLLHALRLHQWRTQAAAALRPNSKYSGEYLLSPQSHGLAQDMLPDQTLFLREQTFHKQKIWSPVTIKGIA